MPGIAIALILGLVAYEFMGKKVAIATKGTSAARATSAARSPRTGAAAKTSALSGTEKLLGNLLSGFSSKPISSRPSQTGFSQPSNQAVNTVTSPGGGTVTYNNDGTITIDGLIYDQNGNLVQTGPDLPPDFSSQVQQSAPGDGTDPLAGFNPDTGNFDLGTFDPANQDVALAQDVNAIADPFAGFDPSTGSFA